VDSLHEQRIDSSFDLYSYSRFENLQHHVGLSSSIYLFNHAGLSASIYLFMSEEIFI
jgi:hypothetical protein